MIAIIDYGMGNVRSVRNALEYIGEEAIVTADSGEIEQADRLILPGVGAFGDAMTNLETRGLPRLLGREVLERRKPFLGICLGLQLLAKTSAEHGRHAGLGWIDGEVVKFEPVSGQKVPHMGWNDVHPEAAHPLLAGLRADQLCFYFVHSLHLVCKTVGDVIATCRYGRPFTAAIARGNIAAMQFHPEKSQDNGVQVLKNFATWKP